MQMLSKLFEILSIIVCIAMIITLIVFWHDTNHLLEYILYEGGIFLLCHYSKYIVDAKFLKRRVEKEMWKLGDRSNRRNKWWGY